MAFQDPFLQLRELAESCLAELAEPRLQPQEIWLHEDPQSLDDVQQALLRLIGSLVSGMHRLTALQDRRFAGVTTLDEWQAIRREEAEWKRDIKALRPEADAQHVQESLISIRCRISELLDGLAVRCALRDPASDATNSTAAAASIAGLTDERDQRELGLGLLEGGGADPWNMALEALDASVVDWSTRLGPEHRVQLEQLCQQLLEHLEAIGRLAERSPALERLSKEAGAKAPPLRKIYDRLLAAPAGKVDAGIASDFHYMAALARHIVEAVRSAHGGILSDHAGKPLPPEVAGLLRTLRLEVPRARKKTGTQTLTRRELELAFGRHLWSGSPQKGE